MVENGHGMLCGITLPIQGIRDIKLELGGERGRIPKTLTYLTTPATNIANPICTSKVGVEH